MKRWVNLAPLLAPLAPVLLLVGAVFGGARSPSVADYLKATPRFATTDSSELFFKNIRSVHYQREKGPAEGFDLFRLRGLTDAPLRPFIVNHWLQDQAYVMYDSAQGPAEVLIDGELTTLSRDRPDEAFTTTMTLCAAFERNAEVRVPQGEVLSKNRRHAKLFLRLCRDYLELVELF